MMIGYCRVSTTDQNPQLQIDAMIAAGCDEIFTDTISGSKRERPSLDKCMARIGKGDTLVIWKLDRLGRSMLHLCSIIEELSKRGIGFRVVTQAIDTTTAGGKLFFHMLAAIAEFERALISERTRSGMKVARAAGKKIGPNYKITAAKATEIQAMAREGEKPGAIARKLNVSPSTVFRYLQRTYPQVRYSERMRRLRRDKGFDTAPVASA